jgi:hypothetical protein
MLVKFLNFFLAYLYASGIEWFASSLDDSASYVCYSAILTSNLYLNISR